MRRLYLSDRLDKGSFLKQPMGGAGGLKLLKKRVRPQGPHGQEKLQQKTVFICRLCDARREQNNEDLQISAISATFPLKLVALRVC